MKRKTTRMHFEVIIIGGGFCGLHSAKKLIGTIKGKIAIIDRKDYFEFTPAVPKVAINPGHAEKIKISFKEVIPKAEVITEKINAVTPEKVVTENGNYTFSYLIISSGSAYPVPLEDKKNVYSLKNSNDALLLHRALNRSKKIVIVGGGLIGTEIAGEIISGRKGKKIVLIEPGTRLLKRNTEEAAEWASAQLLKKGCEIIYGERVRKKENNSIITESNTRITADMFIWCAGIRVNTDFLSDEFSSATDSKGHLNVEKTLQVKGFKNIFCGGDLCDTDEEKTAQNADRHAKIIARNIISLSKGRELKEYTPRTGPLVISIGPFKGLFTYKKILFKGLIPGIMKHVIEKALLFEIKHL